VPTFVRLAIAFLIVNNFMRNKCLSVSKPKVSQTKSKLYLQFAQNSLLIVTHKQPLKSLINYLYNILVLVVLLYVDRCVKSYRARSFDVPCCVAT